MLSKKGTPKFARVRNSTTDWPACISIMVFGVKKRGQLVPNMGKHRAKQELETVPPQELGTVPPRGAKKKSLSGGTVSNSPVGLFLTLDLLLAAVRMFFF